MKFRHIFVSLTLIYSAAAANAKAEPSERDLRNSLEAGLKQQALGVCESAQIVSFKKLSCSEIRNGFACTFTAQVEGCPFLSGEFTNEAKFIQTDSGWKNIGNVETSTERSTTLKQSGSAAQQSAPEALPTLTNSLFADLKRRLASTATDEPRPTNPRLTTLFKLDPTTPQGLPLKEVHYRLGPDSMIFKIANRLPDDYMDRTIIGIANFSAPDRSRTASVQPLLVNGDRMLAIDLSNAPSPSSGTFSVFLVTTRGQQIAVEYDRGLASLGVYLVKDLNENGGVRVKDGNLLVLDLKFSETFEKERFGDLRARQAFYNIFEIYRASR